LPTEEDLLFFTLFSLKTGLTYDALGFVSGMDRANAKRNQTLGLQVLQHALQQAGCLPERTFADAAAFTATLQNGWSPDLELIYNSRRYDKAG
jgi:hypothetical protein